MAGIQFYGKDSVLKFFDMQSSDAWGVFQGSELLHSATGRDDLENYLDMLSGGGTEATYKLRMYPDGTKPTRNADYSGSCQFRLNQVGARAEAMNGPQRYGDGGGVYMKLQNRIDEMIAKKLGKILEDDDDEKDDDDTEDGPVTVGGMVNTFLASLAKNPSQIPALIGAIKEMWNGTPAGAPPPVVPMQYQQRPAASVGTTAAPAVNKPVEKVKLEAKNPAPIEERELTEAEEKELQDRLTAALTTLEEVDPDILEHLEKLADVAKRKPVMFKQLLVMLNGL